MNVQAAVSWRLVTWKECRELLVSGRFLVAAVIVFGLVATTVTVLTRSYSRELGDYGTAVADRQESLRQYGHLNRLGAWSLPDRPNPMTAVVRGLHQNANLESFDNDPLAVAYPLPDLAVVVGVLFSLLALLFAHDAMSGEREDGTLRLLVAHDISRVSIVVGKAVGRSLALLIPLVAGMLIGALVIAASPSLDWSRTEWGAAAVLAAAAAIYVTAFVCLGVMISAWTRTARTSLVVSLGAWAVFILIVPALSPYVAGALRPTDSVTQLQRRARVMGDSERDQLGVRLSREYQAPVRERHQELEAYYALDEEGRRAARASDPRLAAVLDTVRAASDSAWRTANQIQSEAIEALWADFEVKRQAQIRATRHLSSVSPYPAWVYAALDLTGTGLRAQEHRELQAEAFGETTFAPWRRAVTDSLTAIDPTVDWWNTHVDLSGVPTFSYQAESLGGRVVAAAPQIGLLLLFAFAFLAIGVAGFNGYDVR
jgi:ABC-type transport system involved in multi-copper enzyme maturation permease subunit